MSDESRAESIFLAALKLPAEERNAFLAAECGDDRELRKRIDQLLDAHEKLGSFLQPAAGEPTIDQSQTYAEGTLIGPYKLLHVIGEGGMGVVYMADQKKPVQRRVALKIIKPGMDSRQVVARFEAERQALAMMDHPNIARVYDVGEHNDRPYFVMELIQGIPITDYCDRQNCSTAERLKLFQATCNAVQHAHQKGISHRDLKPSNILVTLHDGDPVVKIIDFGVSKALNQQLTEKTLFTRFGQMLGTPQYMSPEQAMTPIQTMPLSSGAICEKKNGRSPMFPSLSSIDLEMHVSQARALNNLETRSVARFTGGFREAVIGRAFMPGWKMVRNSLPRVPFYGTSRCEA